MFQPKSVHIFHIYIFYVLCKCFFKLGQIKTTFIAKANIYRYIEHCQTFVKIWWIAYIAGDKHNTCSLLKLADQGIYLVYLVKKPGGYSKILCESKLIQSEPVMTTCSLLFHCDISHWVWTHLVWPQRFLWARRFDLWCHGGWPYADANGSDPMRNRTFEGYDQLETSSNNTLASLSWPHHIYTYPEDFSADVCCPFFLQRVPFCVLD